MATKKSIRKLASRKAAVSGDRLVRDTYREQLLLLSNKVDALRALIAREFRTTHKTEKHIMADETKIQVDFQRLSDDQQKIKDGVQAIRDAQAAGNDAAVQAEIDKLDGLVSANADAFDAIAGGIAPTPPAPASGQKSSGHK